MFSQGCAGGEAGIPLHGHASPTETPLTWTREEGQMLARPLIRTDQSVGMVMTGTEAACVDG